MIPAWLSVDWDVNSSTATNRIAAATMDGNGRKHRVKINPSSFKPFLSGIGVTVRSKEPIQRATK